MREHEFNPDCECEECLQEKADRSWDEERELRRSEET